MLRLTCKLSSVYFFPTAQKGDLLKAIPVKLHAESKDHLAVKGQNQLYLGINPTRTKILINIINDIVAGRLSGDHRTKA